MFQCEECFDTEYRNVIGSGEDVNGEFTDYECVDCGHVTRIYDELEE